jgi:deoxyribodipyrimidine photolyase-like uncharacterized protein
VLVEQISELITHIRILSLNCVEQIIKWREYLNNIYNMNHIQFAPTGRVITIPYIYQSNNYILKIKTDLAFINYTKAKNYFHFTNKTDPFLLFTTQHL